MRAVLGIHWKDWCWSWNSSTLATSCKGLTHWKRPWCWEGLGAGGEGDNRGWDGWMASPTRWTWIWVDSGSWWWTGRPGMLQITGSQRVGHDWGTEHTHIAVLQCCVSFCWTTVNQPYIHVWKWKWKSLSRVRFFATPWTIQSTEFSRPDYQRG